MIIHELKNCKKDLENYYDYQKKSNIINLAVKKRRLEAIDEAIIVIGGRPECPGVQEELNF
jgi:hypothetical protein